MSSRRVFAVRAKNSNPKPHRNWYVDLLRDLRSLISNQSPFIAGNTKNFVSKTSDPEIFDYVQHGHIEFTDDTANKGIISLMRNNRIILVWSR